MSRAWLRWMPAAAVPAVIAAGVLAGSIPARAGDPLPEKTPAQVLALVAGHTTKTFSGTVEQTSDLGLPELPAPGPTSGPASAGGAASALELLTGQHTARIFMDGPAKVRIQLVDRLAERDLIRRDSDVWFYSSKDNTAAHLTLPAKASDLPLPQPEAPVPPTPDELASRLLAAADPSTEVTVGPDVEVAGRAAYNLVLEPRTEGTLVGSAAIAVDSETGMPLRVSVTARGQAEPAFQSGFASLSLEPPDDSRFSFVPPPGATVKELQPPAPGMHWPSTPAIPGSPGTTTPGQVEPDQVEPGQVEPQPAPPLPGDVPAVPPSPADKLPPDQPPADQLPPELQDGQVPPDKPSWDRKAMPRPSVTGSGWETVIGIPAAMGGQGSVLSESLLNDPLLAQAAVVVPGGRLLSTALVNVLFTDDGRVFVGMVPSERLQAAAGAVAP